MPLPVRAPKLTLTKLSNALSILLNNNNNNNNGKFKILHRLLSRLRSTQRLHGPTRKSIKRTAKGDPIQNCNLNDTANGVSKNREIRAKIEINIYLSDGVSLQRKEQYQPLCPYKFAGVEIGNFVPSPFREKSTEETRSRFFNGNTLFLPRTVEFKCGRWYGY